MSDLIQGSNFGSFRLIEERDLLQELLADKRSPETRRAYERCLKDFFQVISNLEPTPQLIREFLSLERFTAIQLVLSYKAHLIQKGLSEATINQRLSAVKSLVSYAQKVGKCLWSLEEVAGEKVRSYRDTSGINAEDYRKLLDRCQVETISGKRDYALLRLIWDNALRRGELSKLDIKDFRESDRKLGILGKGRGSQKEWITISIKGTDAIAQWLKVHPNPNEKSPLFVSLSKTSIGHRLTGDGIYKIVRAHAEKAGINKVFSPHRGRHSSITAAAIATEGDIRKVQKLSRHSKVETVFVYLDNLENLQGEVSDQLSDLV